MTFTKNVSLAPWNEAYLYLCCFLRYCSMTAFNYAEFHLKVRTDIIPTGDDIIVTDAFFEKATLVLLDIPDWCCISAYVLLTVVCAEALLQVMMLIYPRFLTTVSLGLIIKILL